MAGAETCLTRRHDFAVIAEPYRRFEFIPLRFAKDAGISMTCSSRSTASTDAGAWPWIAVQARLLRKIDGLVWSTRTGHQPFGERPGLTLVGLPLNDISLEKTQASSMAAPTAMI